MTNEALTRGQELKAKIDKLTNAIAPLPTDLAPMSSAQAALQTLWDNTPTGYQTVVADIRTELNTALTAAQAEFHGLSGSFTDGNVSENGTKDVVNLCPFAVTLASQTVGDGAILAAVYGTGTLDMAEGDSLGVANPADATVYIELKLGNTVVSSGWITPAAPAFPTPPLSTFDSITVNNVAP